MGKKLNPEYRAEIARRKQLSRCSFCGRRIPLGKAHYFEEMPFHKVCITRLINGRKARAAEQQAKIKARRERHLLVKDWWLMTREERQAATEALKDD